jgi:hypothetical protein
MRHVVYSTVCRYLLKYVHTCSVTLYDDRRTGGPSRGHKESHLYGGQRARGVK